MWHASFNRNVQLGMTAPAEYYGHVRSELQKGASHPLDSSAAVAHS